MANYFVRQSMGSDGNDGSTKEQAWKTLIRAHATVCADDTVYVGAGDYTLSGEAEDFVWIECGTAGSPVHYIGDYDGTYTDDAGEIKAAYARLEGAWATIENFDFSEYLQEGIDYRGTIFVEDEGKDPNDCKATFKSCKIAERCWVDSVSTTFENCYIGYKEVGHSNMYVLNNTAFERVITITLKHCTVISTGANPNIDFAVDDGANLYSKNNLFINFNANPIPWSEGIYRSRGINTVVTYSDYNHFEYYRAFHYWLNYPGWYCLSLKHWQDRTGHDTHSTEGWAYLMSFTTFSDGYKLKDVSPCIGTAAGGLLYDDIEGNVRDGVAPDKGCYEWQGDPISLIKTYFVRKSGNDANDGLSKENAFLTLRAATDVISQYEKVYIGAGTYDEYLYIPNSGDYTQYIGDLGGNYTDDAGEVHIEAMMNVTAKPPYQLSIVNHHVWLENLHFFDEYFANVSWRAGIVCPAGHGHVFLKTRVDKSILLGSSYCSKVINCVAWPNFVLDAGYAVFTFSIGNTNWIYHNTFVHNTGPGLSPGFNAAFGKYNIVRNNIFVSLSENTPALKTTVADVLTFDYNFYQYIPGTSDMHSHYATLTAWQAAEGHDAHALEGDPMFYPDGYHIEFMSPCRDMADGALLSGMFALINEDIEEELRPFGANSDIGADEVKSLALPEENFYVKVPIANIIRFITPDYANRR